MHTWLKNDGFGWFMPNTVPKTKLKAKTPQMFVVLFDSDCFSIVEICSSFRQLDNVNGKIECCCLM